MANPVYVRYLRTRLTDSTMFRKKQKEPKIELCELWSLWEADLWKMQKAFADYAALDRPAEYPEEKRKEIRDGMQLFIDKYDALCY